MTWGLGSEDWNCSGSESGSESVGTERGPGRDWRRCRGRKKGSRKKWRLTSTGLEKTRPRPDRDPVEEVLRGSPVRTTVVVGPSSKVTREEDI